jgi:hypothetical protein
MYSVTFWITIEGEECQIAAWDQPSDPNFQVGEIIHFDIHNSLFSGHKLFDQTKEEEDLIKSFRFKKLVIKDKGNWVKVWVDGDKGSRDLDKYYRHKTTVNVEYKLELQDA